LNFWINLNGSFTLYLFKKEVRNYIMQVIDEKINRVKESTDDLMQETFEETANNFLDQANDFKGSLYSLAEKFNSLNEDLFSYTNQEKEDSLKNLDKLKSLLSNANELIARVKRNRALYSIVKSELRVFRVETSQLNEIIHDIKLKYIDLPNDKKLREAANKLKSQF